MPTESILVLDDDPQVLQVTVRILMHLGYATLAARSGPEAIALLKAHPGDVHLLLTDAQLPGISGATVARQVQELRPGLKVLLMSGGRNGFSSALPFLGKPFTLQELQDAVRAALNG